MPLVDFDGIHKKLKHYSDPDRLARIWEKTINAILGYPIVDIPLKWACVWYVYHTYTDAPCPAVLTSGLVIWELTLLALALFGYITFDEFDEALDRVRERRNCSPEPVEPIDWSELWGTADKEKKKVKASEDKDKAFRDHFQKTVPTVRVFLQDIDKAREWATWLQLFERKNDIKHDLGDEHTWTEERWKAVEENVMTRLGQLFTAVSQGQDDMRAGQLQPVPMGLLLRDRQGVSNSTPAAPDGHLVLRQPGDRRSVQGVENVAYHQYEELPNREVDVGGVVLGVRGHGGGSDGPQESPYAQIGDLERSSKRKPNPLYVSGRPAQRRSIEKGSNGLCSRCQDQWRGYLIPALLFLFCVVALLLALLALTNAVSHQAGVADQGADPGSTAAQTGDTWNTSVLTSQLAAALDRIQHLEIQNQQLAAQLSVLDNQTMVRQDDLQNQLQATVQQISAVQDSLQTELSQLNSSVMAELDTVSKMEGPRGFNGSQGDQGPSGPVGPAGPSGVSRLDDCEFWDHSSTSDFLGPTELDWLRPEAVSP
uniref:Uncharacterized protein n=1 Tax=Branchiostoma floridae TaxID=7739 RepID=C3Z3L9_BRAFL|eukprot:XP_002596771.1 hypothetical protein BRAFLDRAFT_120491 [Branchiostoma floridae]